MPLPRASAAALGAVCLALASGGRAGAGEPVDPIADVAVGTEQTGRTLVELSVELVDGPRRTRSVAIARLMSTRVGRPLDPPTLDRDLARLRGTGIVYDTDVRFEETPQGLALRMRVKDKWSPLPFLTFRRGGARTTTSAGAWDNNTVGRLFTISGELNSNADIPFIRQSSGDRIGNLVFVVVPRIGGTRLTPGLSWSRDFYDFGTWDSGGRPGFIYDRGRWQLRQENRYDLGNVVILMLGATTYTDGFRVNSRSRFSGTVPVSGTSTAALAGLQIGFVRENLSRYEGKVLVLGLETSRSGLLGSDFTYSTGSADAKAFWAPWTGHNVGLHLNVQGTTGTTDSHLIRAGGLAEIRGFRDAYFVGETLARSNAEYRLEILERRWPLHTITQVATFVDGGYVRGRSGAVAGADYQGPIASAGGGLRVNLVPLARSVGRADLAFGLYPRRTFDIAFGVQQFF